MPELPEVETFVRSLRNGGITGGSILTRQIVSAECFNPNTLATGQSEAEVNGLLNGRIFEQVERRAKYIHIHTDSVLSVIIHLRMSGDLRLEDESVGALQKHDRFVFHFNDGTRLVFNDTRKFGRIWLTSEPDSVLGELGLEPFDPNFTGKWLYENTRKKPQKIKALLLDQHFIAGIGNIYADESLFMSRIHPKRPANTLSRAACDRLCHCVRQVLKEGIEHHGASFDRAYKGGHFQNYFRVYQQEGHPCPVCGHLIEKTTVSQRGTHFCPKCQKLK